MSDTTQGGVRPFPERTQVFRRDRRMTTADEMIRNADDWRIYIRADTVQALIDAAVAALEAIRELNMTGEDETGQRWAHSDLIEQEVVSAFALIRKGEQP